MNILMEHEYDITPYNWKDKQALIVYPRLPLSKKNTSMSECLDCGLIFLGEFMAYQHAHGTVLEYNRLECECGGCSVIPIIPKSIFEVTNA